MQNERNIVISFTEDEIKELLRYLKYTKEWLDVLFHNDSIYSHISGPQIDNLTFARLQKRFESYN